MNPSSRPTSQSSERRATMPMMVNLTDAQRMVLKGIKHLDGRCDGAMRRDGRGFSAADAGHGKRLADWANAGKPYNVQMWAEAWELCRKYQGQLADAGIALPAAAPCSAARQGKPVPAAQAREGCPAAAKLKRYEVIVDTLVDDGAVDVVHHTGKRWRVVGKDGLFGGIELGAQLAILGAWRQLSAGLWDFVAARVELLPLPASAAPTPPAAAPPAAASAHPVALTVRGRITKVLAGPFEGNVAIFELLTTTGEFVRAKGSVPGAVNARDFLERSVEVVGAWKDHPTRGPTLMAVAVRPFVDPSQRGLAHFVESLRVPGIGPQTAQRIAATLCHDTTAEKAYTKLMADPAGVRTVPGISDERLADLAAALAVQASAGRANVDAAARLCELGLNPRRITEVITRFGDKAADAGAGIAQLLAWGLHQAQAMDVVEKYGPALVAIRNNPYILAEEVDGFGFATADKLAQAMGIEPTDPRRLAAGAHRVLMAATERGDCYLSRATLSAEMMRLLDVTCALAEQGITAALKTGRIVDDGDAIYAAKLLEAEREVAQALVRRVKRPPTHSLKPEALAAWEARHGITLAPQQADAVRKAAECAVMVLTGGPGTGKSATTRALVDMLAGTGRRIGLGAPTGRAARRLAEATRREAHTIQRLLALRTSGDADAERVVSTLGALVLDEVSMADIMLMQSVLRSLPDGAKLILVGDVDQLPSIGPGAVLRDIIASGAVPTVRLTQVFRQAQSSLIVSFAHRINTGDVTAAADMPAWDGAAPPGGLAIWEPPEAQPLPDSTFAALERFHGLDFVLTDCMVLSPQRGSGAADDPGVNGLNTLLQTAYNPHGRQIASWSPLRVGDRVLNTENSYEQLDVRNGDLGIIESLVEEGENRGCARVRFDDGRVVFYKEEQLKFLTLGYALTVHKSQGGQAKIVIFVATAQHAYMLQRQLLYTAVTRGEKFVLIIGSRAAVERAIRNGEKVRRNTRLAARIAELV